MQHTKKQKQKKPHKNFMFIWEINQIYWGKTNHRRFTNSLENLHH